MVHELTKIYEILKNTGLCWTLISLLHPSSPSFIYRTAVKSTYNHKQQSKALCIGELGEELFSQPESINLCVHGHTLLEGEV